jgi:hypothetical protein
MGLIRISRCVLMITTALTPLAAQTGPDSLTAAQIALACAPPAAIEPAAPTAARVLGAQDTLPHTIFSPQDLLVIDGGIDAGLQLGQLFFIRRAPVGTGPYMAPPARAYASMSPITGSSTTAGWLRIVALNQTTSIARIEHMCGAIFKNDYLEPFDVPSVPPDLDRDDSTGELDFTSLSRVVAATESRRAAAPGEYVLIDRGADQGIAPGRRLAIYRDLRAPGMPLMALGEAVVMSTATNTALVRINRARDAVLIGDYLVPRGASGK